MFSTNDVRLKKIDVEISDQKNFLVKKFCFRYFDGIISSHHSKNILLCKKCFGMILLIIDPQN